MGKIPILTNIFQMGWNHQLVMFIGLEGRPSLFFPAVGASYRVLELHGIYGAKQSSLHSVFVIQQG